MRILISRKPSDYAFVTSAITRLRLNPRVKDRPASKPDGSIVECYAWGEVVFTHDHDDGSTIVVVFENEQPFSVNDCFGHASSVMAECCGDAQSRPCHLFNRCVAVRNAAKTMKVTPENLLLCYSIEEIVAKKLEALAPKTSKTVKRPRVTLVEDEEKLVEAANQFFREVAKAAGLDLVVGGEVASKRHSLNQGQLYIRDRTKTSGYLGMYVYNESWDDPVIALRPVPRRKVWHVKLPVTREQFLRLDHERSCKDAERASVDKNSRFKLLLKGVTSEQLEGLRGVVAHMIKNELYR